MIKFSVLVMALLSAEGAMATDMGNYGLSALDIIAQSYNTASTDAPKSVGTIVYQNSDGTFQGLTTTGYVPLSIPAAATTYAQSSAFTSNSAGLTSTTFSAFSPSATFTFTPGVTGKYKIYSSVPNRTYANLPTIKIANTVGSGTLLAESQGTGDTLSASSSDQSSYLQSVYSLTAGTTYTFELQAKVLSGGSITLLGGQSQFYIFAEKLN